MSIPANPATNLIVVQAQIFGVFKIFLNTKACPNRLHHLL